MKMRALILVLVLVLPASLVARTKTDVVVMKNGDHLTGEIKGLSEGVLYLDMEYILGTSSVQWSKVEHLESKQLFLVKTADGAVYTGTMNTPNAPDARRPVEIRVVETSGQEVVIDRSRIVQMDTTSEKFFQRFNGSINTGIIYSKGNQSTQYSLGSQLTYPRERWGAAAGFTSTLSSSTGATCAPQEFDPTLWAPCNIVTSYPAQANSCSLLSLIRNEFEARSVLTRDRLPVLDSTALLEFRAWQFWVVLLRLANRREWRALPGGNHAEGYSGGAHRADVVRRGSSRLSRWLSPCCSRHRTIDPQCLENPRPAGAESTLTENARSPFHAEPRQVSLTYFWTSPFASGGGATSSNISTMRSRACGSSSCLYGRYIIERESPYTANEKPESAGREAACAWAAV